MLDTVKIAFVFILMITIIVEVDVNYLGLVLSLKKRVFKLLIYFLKKIKIIYSVYVYEKQFKALISIIRFYLL